MNRTLLRALIWLTVFGACSALILTFIVLRNAVEDERHKAKRLTCSGHLRLIGVSLHRYHEKYGCFPPAYVVDEQGKPMHSWRVLLLEFIDSDLYELYKFDEPWNGPNNRKLLARMPVCYTCPNDPIAAQDYLTNYVAIVGPSTVFPGAKTTSLKDIPEDGNSRILIAEVRSFDIQWMEPRDLDVNTMSFSINDPFRPSISSNDRTGPAVCLTNGEQLRLNESFSPEILRRMVIISARGNSR